MALAGFKARYAPSWQYSALREKVAEHLIRLILPGQLQATGIGTGSSEMVDDWGSPPDFYHLQLGWWFEVTGTELTRDQSSSVCARKFHRGEPHLFVREGKVEAAKSNRVASKLAFVSVNEMDGSVLFLPCSRVLKGDYCLVEGFERGGERYYAVPWRDWWTPHRLVSWLGVRA